MKKILITLLLSMLVLTGCASKKTTEVQENWTNCNKNHQEASKIAGFEFPLELENYEIKAMPEMMEYTYQFDESRTVVIRKKVKSDKADISGDTTRYAVDRAMRLPNEVPIHIRGDEQRIYVMYMEVSTGYYSVRCEGGLNLKELEDIYYIIADAEARQIEF